MNLWVISVSKYILGWLSMFLIYLQSLSEGIIIRSELNIDKAGLGGELIGLGGGGVRPGCRHQVGLEVVPPVLSGWDLEDTGTLHWNLHCLRQSLTRYWW